MKNKDDQYRAQLLNRIQKLNLTIRRRLEKAEAVIPPLNEQISQLCRTKFTSNHIVRGPVVGTRGYAHGEGPEDSGMVLQAALRLPGGIGMIYWDADDDGSDEETAFVRFWPFEQCEPADKARLLLCLDELLEMFEKIVFSRKKN